MTALRNVGKDIEKSRDQLTRGETTLKSQAVVDQEFTDASAALKQARKGHGLAE